MIVSTFSFKGNRRIAMSNHGPNSSGRTHSVSSSEVPSHYTEYHTLSKIGDSIRVDIPPPYKCKFYGGGKKYYNHPQNCKRQVWGGNSCPTGLDFPEPTYSDISFYQEEITIRCEFSIPPKK